MSVIRPATPDDHAHFVRLFPELGTDDSVPAMDHWCATMMPDTFLVEDAAAVVAYGYGQVLGESGYIRHVVVAPDARGHGFGRVAMDEFARRFRDGGCREWRLNVLDDNEPALGLYASCGMAIEHRTSVVRLGWPVVESLPEPACRTEVREPGADDEPAFERALGIQPRFLARLREQGVGVAIGVWVDGEPAAVARFAPDFPGALPFAARSPDLARPLLDAIRPHSRADRPVFQLVIENDAALTNTLLSAGATLKHRLAHLSGPLPAG